MFRCHFELLRMCIADFYQFERMISTVMKTLVLVIIAGILSGSQCLVCSDPPAYNLKLRIGEHDVVKLPNKSRLNLDCERVSDCVFGNKTIQWFKDGLNITGNHTHESVYLSHDRRLLIVGLSEGIGMGNDTEGNYTCRVCQGQVCNESTLPIIVDKGVILSFEQCEYNVIESNHLVILTLIASQATDFSYTVEISVKDVDTTRGSDYSEPMEVTFEANQTTAEVPIRIVNDFIAERKESFNCSISNISLQNISWNKVPAIVNIEDDDILEVDYSGPLLVRENVSNSTLTIQTIKNASFEYTMCLTAHELNTTGGINIELRPNTVVFKPYQTMATVDVLISGNNIGKRDEFVISGKLPNAKSATNYTIAGLVIIENFFLNCDELDKIENGDIEYSNGTVYQSVATYNCHNGHNLTMPGDEMRTCGSDGMWNGSAPTCSIVNCGPLRNIPNGAVDTSNGTNYMFTAIYKCDPGYVPNGNITRTCQADGMWSGSEPTCDVVPCMEEFDIFQWHKTSYGSSAEANCSDIHPDFGSSKAKRRCLQNGTWDQVDLTSCTFKNTTRKTPIFLINAVINGSNTTEVQEKLLKVAKKYSIVTNSFTLNTTISNQTVVTFVIEFSENTTSDSRDIFINAVRRLPQFEYVLGIIPSDQCSCDISEQANNRTRDLCIGTADARSPCECNQNNNRCQCVAPYINVANTDEVTCILNRAQVGCPEETDKTWNITWMMTEHNGILNVNCPGDSVGLASRKCGSNGIWGEIILTECVSKAFLDFQMESEVLKEFLKLNGSLNDEQRQHVTQLTGKLLKALNSSLLPGDLTIATNFIQNLASLSEENGLFDFDGPDKTKLQMTVANVLNTLLDSKNGWAFLNFKNDGTSKVPSPAVTLLDSTERLIRSGFVPSNESQPRVLVDDNIAIQANRLNLSSFPATFPDGNFSAFMKADMIPQVVIPRSFIKTRVSAVPGVVSFTLDNIQDYLPLQFANETDKINFTGPGSLIVSSQVVDVNTTTVNRSSDSVNISFPLLVSITDSENVPKELHCAFWEFQGRNGSGGWSFDGVRTVSSNSTHVQCASKHLTSFIVLVSTEPIEQKDPSTDPMSWLTYIGCGISLLFLLLCIIFFLSLRKDLITHTHNFVHLNLCIALSCGLLFYLGGIRPAAWNDILCKTVTAFLHYFFLAAFTWMLCEAIMIYIFTVEVFGANNRKWIYMYLLLGWGLPIPVVIVSVAVKHTDYLIRHMDNHTVNYACWLPLKDGLVYAFIGPMIAILIVNLVLIIISMTSLARSKFGMPTQVEQEPKEGIIVARKLIKAFLVVMPLMGFTWIIGLLAVGHAHEALSYVFIVLNSLQGLFIFIFHVARHDKVWSKIKTIIPARTRRKLKRMTIQKFKPKSIDLNDSDKKFETTGTFKTFSSLDDGKDAQLVSERRKKFNSDSSDNMEDTEMENRNGMNTLNQTNMESSVTSTNFGVNEPGNDVPAQGKDTPEPLKSRCQQATELLTTAVIEPQSLGESNISQSETPTYKV